MNDRLDLERLVTHWLRAGAPTRAPNSVLATALERVEAVRQERPLGGRQFDTWVGRSPRLHWAIVGALLAAALLGAIAGGGALLRTSPPKLNLAPPADLQAFVLSTYDRMPQMPPVAITTLTDGSVKGRMYVDRSGAVRFEVYATPDAPTPDTYEILNGTTMGQLAIVGSTREWVQQNGAISEDPRVFLLAQMEGGAADYQHGCGLARNQGQIGNGTTASGWKYVDAEYVIGRPTFHVSCAGGDIWIDVQTRLILRSEGPVRNASFGPVPGSSRTIEVTDIQFGEQPADLFVIAQPAGVSSVSSEAYQCQLNPPACATPEPAQPAYTPPPDAIYGPLPPLPPSRVSNGWIAYSTSGHGRPPSSTDLTAGSDIYLVRAGVAPRLIAGREGGKIRNECPAFSPDGRQLAYSFDAGADRAMVVLSVDAKGGTTEKVRFAVPGSGLPACPRWSSDGTRVAYLDGATVIVRGLDGSTPPPGAGDPTVQEFAPAQVPGDPLLSPSGEWVVRPVDIAQGCEFAVTRPDGTSAHVITPTITTYSCGYAIATWSPDGRQFLVMVDVSGFDFTMLAIGVDSSREATIVSTVRTNGSRSWPGLGDVSWQPVFP